MSRSARTRRPRKLLLAGALGATVGVLALAAAAPERVLQAEFARQRWLAGAEPMDFEAAGHRWAAVAAGSSPAATLRSRAVSWARTPGSRRKRSRSVSVTSLHIHATL